VVTHITIIVTYTILSIVINFPTKVSTNFILNARWNSIITFVAAVADLFISVTLWIITDQDQILVAVTQGDR